LNISPTRKFWDQGILYLWVSYDSHHKLGLLT
jgi:hypothetical protein